MQDLNPTYYSQHSTLQHQKAEEILANYAVKEDAAILDVGCGDGRITAELAERIRKGHITGVDASKSMIMHAKSTYSMVPQLEFCHSLIEQYRLERPLDAVVSFSCFHWVREAKAALNQLCDSLKPGGDLIILTYPKESGYYPFMQSVLTEQFPEFVGPTAYETMLSIDEYHSQLIENQMKVEQFEVRDLVLKHENAEEFKGFVRGWLNSFVTLPDDLQESYLDKLAEAAEKKNREQGKSGIELPYAQLLMRAKKPRESQF